MVPTADEKKKRQAILAGALFAIVIGLAVWDFSGSSGTVPHRSPLPATPARLTSNSITKGRLSAVPSSFHLQLDLLASSEGMNDGDVRDLFGGPSAPVAVESPIAPARPTIVNPKAFAPVKIDPPIDVDYRGFAESAAGNVRGLFTHGADIAIAQTGEIIFHRFRVGTIRDGSAQITDLVSNRTHPLVMESDK